MKALLLMPAVALLGACAHFGGTKDTSPEQIVLPTETGAGERQTPIVSTADEMMLVSDATRFDGSDYATYTEHLVDTTTGTVTGTRHFVMGEGTALDCPLGDCAGTLAAYYGVSPAYISTKGK